MKYFGKWLGAVLLGVTLVSGVAQANEDEQIRYVYCVKSISPESGFQWVVSSVFKVNFIQTPTYKIKSSFDEYVATKFVFVGGSSTECNFASSENQALANRLRWIDQQQNHYGTRVDTIRWSYRGD